MIFLIKLFYQCSGSCQNWQKCLSGDIMIPHWTNVLHSSALCLLILIIPLKAQGLTFPNLTIYYDHIPKSRISLSLQKKSGCSNCLWACSLWVLFVALQACEHLSLIRTLTALMALQTPNRKVVCDSESRRSQRHPPPFILEKFTLQAQVSASLCLTMHVLKYFSVQAGKYSTYYWWHFYLTEKKKFRDKSFVIIC